MIATGSAPEIMPASIQHQRSANHTLRIVCPNGHLGFAPIKTGSFRIGCQSEPDLICADSGSCDVGPVPLGAVGYLGLLTAENTYNTALLALAQARAARYADTAALFQALGGGWWNRENVAPAKNWDIQLTP